MRSGAASRLEHEKARRVAPPGPMTYAAMKLRFCVACGTDDVVPVGFDGTQRARDE